MREIYVQAGRRIMMVREMRNMSRAVLARESGHSAKFIYEIENGKKGFSAASLYDICKALGIDPTFILCGESPYEIDEELAATIRLFGTEKSLKLSRVIEDIHKMM